MFVFSPFSMMNMHVLFMAFSFHNFLLSCLKLILVSCYHNVKMYENIEKQDKNLYNKKNLFKKCHNNEI